MTREKQNSDSRRTIMDLSWPKGFSVNDAIHKCEYLDSYFTLQYPSIDHIIDKVKAIGPGSLLYKVDISKAFRHIRIDSGDKDLLGLHYKHMYLDGSMPFGYRLRSGIFERCSDAIRYIMRQHGYPNRMNYIDDIIYIDLPSKFHSSYNFLLSLLHDLGLQVSETKLVPPHTKVTCLGIVVNTVDKTISIPSEKLQEIHDICVQWTSKNNCTKKQLQSLLGSLLYITKCMKPARFFLNRMLQVLRESHDMSHITLSPQFHLDLNWFNIFLKQYNGVTFFDNKPVNFQVHLDASLSGLGSVFGHLVYALPLGTEFKHLHITQLEMLNVVVALKLWSNLWSDKKVRFFSDNLAVVEVLKLGKTKDPFWQFVPEIFGLLWPFSILKLLLFMSLDVTMT